ncbi:MAG TPA: hypothetical protein VHG93_21175 [Longimicrobium sp.]|nr:hypothetical protein [Longimicrobium sp.]
MRQVLVRASFEMTAHGADFVRATKSAMNLYFRFFVDFVAGKQGDAELSFRRRRLHRTQPVQDFHGAD